MGRASGPGERSGMTELLARLGNVIYWLFTGVAVLGVLGGVFSAIFGGTNNEWWQDLSAGAAVAILFWGIGRAFRYVLAGK